METVTIGELAREQESRGGGALVSFGKPLRRYQRSATSAQGSSGRAFRSRRALNLRAMNALYLRDDLIDELQLDERTPASGFTCEGDVILALTAPHPCVVIDTTHEGLFVPSSCAIIRMDAELRARLDPWYLAGCLALPPVREQLRLKASGGRMAQLTVESICATSIPVATPERQGETARVVRAHARAMAALAQIEQAQEQLVYAAVASAAR